MLKLPVTHPLARSLFATLLTLAVLSPLCEAQQEPARVVKPAAEPQWFKGNLHTHSLWSDGDDFPEMIAAWYVEHDYNFLALSDHNTLSSGMRWMPLAKIQARSDKGVLDRYRQRFGDSWVETRPIDSSDSGPSANEVRLKPLNEFRALVEQAGSFIMIQGEEISGSAEGKPVHMNVTNVEAVIKPINGDTARESMTNNIRQVREQEARSGREMMIHLNHPNFYYAVTAEDLAHVVEEQFYEVYNGHPGVNHRGDDSHISVEQIWDVANAIRLSVLDAAPMFGIGTDDSHEYHGMAGSRPGRGWVMVRAEYLTPEHLIKALKRGDFYASSGVELDDVRFDASQKELRLSIRPQAGVTFKTEFIASLADAPEDGALPKTIGKVMATSDSLTPSYTMTGKELYVRAVVTSSQVPVDPAFEGQFQQAWTQPVGWTVE